MQTLITVIHVSACFLLILLVLVQSGKGAEISASFGGSSQTVFGSSGGANFFTKLTAWTAAVFMVTSVSLTLMSSDSNKSVFDNGQIPITTQTEKAPTQPEATQKADTAKAKTEEAKK